ncbi:MAG: TatD family hydrolase [Paludibacter sp.]|nr:TatD family hydrolase [Paludibacter sp.]
MHMLTDIHSHKVNSGNVRTIYNIRINDHPVSLPHGSNILFSAGIHPWDAGNIRSVWLENMEILMNFEQVVALGECGLDKNAPFPMEKQLEVFELQIKLSETHKKPMIIHCVGCFNELVNLRKALNPRQPWIIHGFRGKPELADQLIRAGLYLSFGELYNQESVSSTPFERLLVETDESEMSIEDIYEKISILKECRAEDLNAAESIFRF